MTYALRKTLQAIAAALVIGFVLVGCAPEKEIRYTTIEPAPISLNDVDTKALSDYLKQPERNTALESVMTEYGPKVVQALETGSFGTPVIQSNALGVLPEDYTGFAYVTAEAPGMLINIWGSFTDGRVDNPSQVSAFTIKAAEDLDEVWFSQPTSRQYVEVGITAAGTDERREASFTYERVEGDDRPLYNTPEQAQQIDADAITALEQNIAAILG